MARNEEMSVLHTEASAEATQDTKGNPTIVVKAAHRDGNSSWGNRIHMSQEAAQALLSDLLRVTTPAKPRHLVEVVFRNGEGMAEFENGSYTVRHGELIEIETEAGERGTVPLTDVLYVRTHAK